MDDSIKSFEKEKDIIYSMLKDYYVGFDTMVEKGFTKKAWDEISNYTEVTALFDKCINDTHLFITNHKDFSYRQNQVFDEDSIKSSDSAKTHIAKATSNTYYIRYNSCDIYWKDYADFPTLASTASQYDYIILDFRSNPGGGNGQQWNFFYNLMNFSSENDSGSKGYKGTIFVTQDNWSYSAGEVWIMANQFTDYLDIKLIGTHSGGMQIYGNCKEYTKNGLYFYLPSTSFVTQLPANYLGEGKGYEPDIWANKNTMKATLEELGLDLTGIEFN